MYTCKFRLSFLDKNFGAYRWDIGTVTFPLANTSIMNFFLDACLSRVRTNVF